MTSTPSKISPNRGISRGFDSFADVVPGNVAAALEALELPIIKEVAGEVVTHCPAHVERLGHPDHDPSFSVNLETGLNFCQSCKFGGRFTDLVAYVQKCNHAAAVAWIRSKGTVAAIERMLAPPTEKSATEEITEASLALFTAPPDHELERRRISRGAAKAKGILWDPKKRTWILPIRHPRTGKLWGWQTKRGKHVRNRPIGVEKKSTLFGVKWPLTGDIVVVESPLDTAVLFTVGIPGAVSLYGSAPSPTQISILARTKGRVIIFMDNDAPGWMAARKLAEALRGRGVPVLIVTYEGCAPGADPGDLYPRDLRRLVRAAVPAPTFEWERWAGA
jgi:hypothetical protein